jgi:WD40 repeat protein
MKGHKSQISSVALRPNGQRTATSSTGRTVRLWNRGAGQETLTLRTYLSRHA